MVAARHDCFDREAVTPADKLELVATEVSLTLAPREERSGLRVCELARNQAKDRDYPSSLSGLLTVVGVLREDTVGKIPQSLPLGFVLDDFGPERQAAENDVGMLAQVVVPGWVGRPPPLGSDDRHPITVVKIERGIPTCLSCSRAS